MFIQDIFFVLNPLIHSFTISANEVDATDSIRSHRGQPAVAAMEGHVTGNQLIPGWFTVLVQRRHHRK